MDVKERLELVLGVRICDEQVDFVKTYYNQFYESPEEFIGDGLVDVILDDLGLRRPDTLVETCDMIYGLHMRWFGGYDTLAWGSYGDQDVYAVRARGQDARDIAEFVRDRNWNSEFTESPVMIVHVFNDEPDKAVVLVTTYKGALSSDIRKLPGYTCMGCCPIVEPGETDVRLTYYVPFARNANSKCPVMWIDHTGQIPADAEQSLGYVLEDSEILSGIVTKSEASYLYSGITSNVRGDGIRYVSEKFVSLKFDELTVVYNSNHCCADRICYSVEAVSPILFYYIVGMDNIKTNAFDVICEHKGWDSLYSKVCSQDESVEPVDVVHSGKGSGQRTSAIGKMLDGATSDYGSSNVK